MPDPGGKPSVAEKRNIRAVMNSLERASARRTASERAADAVTTALGRPLVLAIHVCFYGAWLVWNSAPGFWGLRPFDPFPFSLLTLSVSLEAILLTLFVLTSQNRIRREADHHAHVDLQVNLLAELEATKMLGMLQSLCAHFGLEAANDREIDDLRARTDPERLFETIRESLPSDT
ncbi:MAG: DUF1003 domain-containing protein [Methylobacteriaceae bacterium]|nr:DUF1003 domain-containing protein [Methylobacteriaceae bacterium]MBV9218183.1 DUF1003 domain-containing protein [Methylobacteriaceae bacterium]MBV9244858.1 DUF1003 domain-containing protein [Methylobacteriaceae bacterium]MBV9635960.1 DUF1003 domain-containing protein [Methylobacteriaceae bacterium]MBV9702600.1 DUF1003 domain-containing protein [Methylobacteriaceae bacterium]